MMSDTQRPDEIRRRVLDRMERSETLIKLSIAAAALVEAVCLVLLVALGGHVTRSTLRILKAVELVERAESRRP